MIVHLQEEIKQIKNRLENLPGYDIGKLPSFLTNGIGEVPPHLMKLKIELEKTYHSLEQKNELLIN